MIASSQVTVVLRWNLYIDWKSLMKEGLVGDLGRGDRRGVGVWWGWVWEWGGVAGYPFLNTEDEIRF